MKQTLVPGDKIIVNKLVYGPKLPNSLSEIPWLNVFSLLNKNNDEKIVNEKNIRLQGFNTIERKDVIVFFRPGNREVYVKRCMGMPGDNLELYNNKLFIDDSLLQSPTNVVCSYYVYSNKMKNLFRYLKNKQIDIVCRDMKNSLTVLLTDKNKNEIENLNYVDSLKFVNSESKKSNIINNRHVIFRAKADNLFISGQKFKTPWSIFNFGSLYIPKKGDKIFLNKKNISFYSKIIKEHENHELVISDSIILIDGKETNYYKFEQNYYFMLGDNRSQSLDSRYWGFVPESHIIGKAVKILFSNKKFDFKKNRFYKNIM